MRTVYSLPASCCLVLRHCTNLVSSFEMKRWHAIWVCPHVQILLHALHTLGDHEWRLRDLGSLFPWCPHCEFTMDRFTVAGVSA